MDAHADHPCRCGASLWVYAAVARVDPREPDDAADQATDVDTAARIVCCACGEGEAADEPPGSSKAPANPRAPGLAWAALAGTATMMAVVIVLA